MHWLDVHALAGCTVRTLNCNRCCSDVSNDTSCTSTILPLECNVGQEYCTADNVLPSKISVYCACCHKCKGGTDQTASDLKIHIIDPQVSTIDHQPGLAHNEKALPGLERQQISGDVGREL